MRDSIVSNSVTGARLHWLKFLIVNLNLFKFVYFKKNSLKLPCHDHFFRQIFTDSYLGSDLLFVKATNDTPSKFLYGPI